MGLKANVPFSPAPLSVQWQSQLRKWEQEAAEEEQQQQQ